MKNGKVLGSREGRGQQYQWWPPGGALSRAQAGASGPLWLEVEKTAKKRQSPQGPRRSWARPPVPCVHRRYRGGAQTREKFQSPQSPGAPGLGPLSPACSAGTGGKRKLAKNDKVPRAQELLGSLPSSLRGATGTGGSRPLPPAGVQGASRRLPGRGAPSPATRRGPGALEPSRR